MCKYMTFISFGKIFLPIHNESPSSSFRQGTDLLLFVHLSGQQRMSEAVLAAECECGGLEVEVGHLGIEAGDVGGAYLTGADDVL